MLHEYILFVAIILIGGFALAVIAAVIYSHVITEIEHRKWLKKIESENDPLDS